MIKRLKGTGICIPKDLTKIEEVLIHIKNKTLQKKAVDYAKKQSNSYRLQVILVNAVLFGNTI